MYKLAYSRVWENTHKKISTELHVLSGLSLPFAHTT